ncbi:energy transducer TonB family protein [Fulvivirga lutea]|uniref:TonB C-terminal domain-containing protein n=1 Tax=Fulvivirga lutea TaxID=2810512 RepID=A0A974WGI2_9BACT|nr:energy transducer TonB [Fulvivirga lutea]QSE97238.1 hypothetical protein JR347_16850 [Fulvivirga lutea]
MKKYYFILFLGLISNLLSAQINDRLKGNSSDNLQIVEQSAKPNGGYAKLYKYLNKKAKFPKDYDYPNDKGEVYVQFIIDESGKVDKNSISIPDKSKLEGKAWILTDNYFTELAIKKIENMPPWIPAEHNGQKVKQMIMLPITFRK